MEQGAATTGPISGHSLGKMRRRGAILDAVRGIMAQTGEAGLTMSALAARAGVSPATPYNLFGSKQAILRAVYEEDVREFFARFDRHASTVPLDRVFDLADLTVEHWQSAPEVYKALLTVLSRNAGSDVGGDCWSPARSHARRLVGALGETGALVPGASIEAISRQLIRIVKSVSQEWVDGEVTLDQARNELNLAFGIVLTGFLTPAAAAALKTILERAT